MSINITVLTPDDLVSRDQAIAQIQTQVANLQTQLASLVAPPPVPVNKAPIASAVPTISFQPGVPARISIAQYFVDPDGDPLTITDFSPNGLPPGITYNPATKEFVYDGNLTGGMTGGNVLTADDGRG